jgi:hypothetical protein
MEPFRGRRGPGEKAPTPGPEIVCRRLTRPPARVSGDCVMQVGGRGKAQVVRDLFEGTIRPADHFNRDKYPALRCQRSNAARTRLTRPRRQRAPAHLELPRYDGRRRWLDDVLDARKEQWQVPGRNHLPHSHGERFHRAGKRASHQEPAKAGDVVVDIEQDDATGTGVRERHELLDALDAPIAVHDDGCRSPTGPDRGDRRRQNVFGCLIKRWNEYEFDVARPTRSQQLRRRRAESDLIPERRARARRAPSIGEEGDDSESCGSWKPGRHIRDGGS